MIPYGHQDISKEDIQAVEAVLRSEWLTQGPVIDRFEKVVSDYCGASQAVAVNSATSALHLACLALGLGPGDKLWTTPNTFVASANCGRYCGAEIDFVDIDAKSMNIDLSALSKKLHESRKSGQLPKVLVPVHFAGMSCDMKGIHSLAQEFGFRVIEDAAHAVGGRFEGSPIGSCRYSDITVFSFHPVKIVTTGEGGMALTNDPVLAERMRRMRSHGITRDAGRQESLGAWYYEQIDLGFNFRLTDLQAALGVSQMLRINEFVTRRRALADRYARLLAGTPLKLPSTSLDSAWHLYVIQLNDARLRRAVFDSMRAAGIGVNVHYIPVHTQPDYQKLGFQSGHCPVAEDYYSRALTLPLFPALSEYQQDYVAETLKKILN